MGDTRFDALTRIAPPGASPVTLSEVKDHIEVEDDDRDALIQRLLDAAVAYVDATGVLGQAMITQTWAQTGYGWRDRVDLTITPVQSLSAVKYYDTDNVEQTATLSDFRLIGGARSSYVEPVGSWPQTFDRPDALRLEYVAGYGDAASDVPENIRNAVCTLAGHFFNHREAYSEGAVREVPMLFEALIGNERASWYG